MRIFNAIAMTCALLVVPFSFSSADDQQTETLHSNAYQEVGVAFDCVPYASDCDVYFPVTQHANTVVTNISCNFTATAGSETGAAFLTTNADAKTYMWPRVSVPIYYLGTGRSGLSNFGINAQVNFFIKQGDTPYFYLSLLTGAAGDFTCLISGYHS